MLTPATPARTGNGLAMRLGQFLEALTRICDVDLIVAPVCGSATSEQLRWPRQLGSHVQVLDVDETLDSHFALVMQVRDPAARAEAFARYGLPSLASRLSTAAAARCRDLTAGRDYALVHASRSYCAPLAMALAGPHSVLTLDLDEDDGRVFRGLAALAAKRGRHAESRWSLLEAEAFDRLSRTLPPGFTRVWASSPVDAARLGASAVMPNAIEMPAPAGRRDDGRTLLFVGSLGYQPNADAVDWFVRSVWPRIRRERGLRFRGVGPDAAESVRRLGWKPGVDIAGWQADLRASYAEATLCVAPLRVGAGARIKLLEAAAHGLPIVSTTIGAEGLGLDDGRHLWLADTAAEFASTIEEALARPAEARRRAGQARSWVARHFDRNAVVGRLAAEFAALL